MLRKAVQSATRLTGALRAAAPLCPARTFAAALPRFHSEPSAPIQTRLENNVLTLTFNRPESFNAMTVEMGECFEQIMQKVHDSVRDAGTADEVKAVVVTGAGKAFSSGGDLQYLLDRAADTPANNVPEMQRFYRRFLAIRKSPVPTIAAINGPCVGAGACFALACDVRVMSSSAYLGFIFSKLALHPGLAATHFLPKIVGPQAANKFLLTGDMIQAAEAKETGLVATVVEPTELTAVVGDLARKMVVTSSLAQRLLLQTLRDQQDDGLDRALTREAETQALCYEDPVFRANVLAIKNKNK